MRFGQLATAGLLSLSAIPALADTCWDHNGSLMRLVSTGNARVFVYDQPRPGLAAVGVAPGRLLFKGAKVDNVYVGTARVFLAACGGLEQEYPASGPVSADQLTITLTGKREVFGADCRPAGSFTSDTLRFTYVRQCGDSVADRSPPAAPNQPPARDPQAPPQPAPGLRPVGGGAVN